MQLFKLNIWRRATTLIVLMGMVMALLLPAPAMAASVNCAQIKGQTFFIFTTWAKYLECDSKAGVYVDSLSDVGGLAFWAVDNLLRLSGFVAAGFVVWGGVKYIKSEGEPSEITAAKDTIMQAIVGLVIAIISIGLVQFVAERF